MPTWDDWDDDDPAPDYDRPTSSGGRFGGGGGARGNTIQGADDTCEYVRQN